MTTIKPREFWVDPEQYEGQFIAFDQHPKQGPLQWQEALIHVREVLREPTDGELKELAAEEGNIGWLWADKNLREKNPAICYEYGVKSGYKAGFHAALAWMRGKE